VCLSYIQLLILSEFANLSSNTFNIPEIICDPTLTLSPHVFLLGLLFLFKAFKSPSLLSAKDLYSLKVLDGLNEQACPLRDEIGDNYVFCIAVREAHGVRIVREKQLTSAWVRSRMKQGGEITGFLDIVHPYCLRDGNAKSLNDSRKSSFVLYLGRYIC